MAGRLLFVILIYSFHKIQTQDSFHKIQTQALLPPTLKVNSPEITETDSVTLHCQTPPSVSVSHCYFRTVKKESVRVFSCLKTLTGTELLLISEQSSPAEVQVKCFYTVKYEGPNHPSPHSDTSFITIHTLPPPTLTVNPPVITETDSVTLHCQTPPSVSVSQCYFYTLSGGTRVFSCLKTLTGTELLMLSQQSSPAEVQVKCFYTITFEGSNYPSPHSDPSSITVHNSFPKIQTQALPPPTLTVNPPVITETDSVTLHCQTPPSVSVSDCYFYILSGGIVKVFSCQKTLTGTELLQMSQQRSPAEVQVKCYYYRDMTQSPESDVSSIFIHTLLPPTLTVNPPVITETDSVTLHCQTPPSVSVSDCYFYTLSGRIVRIFSCLKTLTGTELLQMSQQSSPAQVQVKCYYTVKLGGSTAPSPHSDTSSITVHSQNPYTSSTQAISPSVTPETPSSETWTWKLVIVAASLGGVIVLRLAFLFTKRTTERCAAKRTHANVTDDLMCMRKLDHGGSLPAGNDEAYSMIPSVPAAVCLTGPEKTEQASLSK
ncbi:uncharacterized protein LOC117489703 isoform X1 [Trematomus bernacchii]|uniref:uncharacterized protein LOC117489703 isoform X1 n=1 Tax=Trematomus bernacchii TaxID=40690 RepID=UPI001469B0C7|nr:uncharacterized protein LOC117489703 isoform X1 [Trematomus bernacchii]